MHRCCKRIAVLAAACLSCPLAFLAMVSCAASANPAGTSSSLRFHAKAEILAHPAALEEWATRRAPGGPRAARVPTSTIPRSRLCGVGESAPTESERLTLGIRVIEAMPTATQGRREDLVAAATWVPAYL
jgi:hypothetical protein